MGHSRSLPAWLTRTLLALALLVMAGSAVFGAVVVVQSHLTGVPESSDRPGGVLDYVAFHAAARLVREGDGDKMYDLTAVGRVETETVGRPIGGETVLPFFNPPFVAVAFAPFAGLDLSSFVAVLFALNLVLFVVTAIVMEKMLALQSRRERLFYWLFSVSLFPVFALFIQQQLTLWICLAWLGLVSFETRGKSGWAGASLALGLVKPQMVLLPLLFLVLHRRWQTLAWFGAAAAPLVLVSIAVVGPQGVVDYPRFLLDSTSWETNGINARQMFGWNGLIADLTGDLSPARAVLLAFALPTLALVAWSWRGDWHSQLERLPGLMGLSLIAALLINPHLYLYDMTLAGLALGLGVVQARRRDGSLGVWPLLAMAFWVAQLPLPGADYSRGFPLISLAAVVLFGLLWHGVRQGREASNAPEVVRTTERLAA